MSDRLRQFLLVFLAISSLVMVGLAVGLPLGGHSTGYISDKYPTAITPAGWAFAIWSLIYTGLAGFTLWQALPAQQQDPRLRGGGPWVMGVLMANGLWLPAWHYEQIGLSTGIIFIYLVCLVRALDAFARHEAAKSRLDYLLTFALFSVWAGWLTVATVLNVTVWLVSLGIYPGLNPEAWGVILLSVAFFIAWLLFLRWRSPWYLAVIAWAYLAIRAKHPGLEQIQLVSLVLALLAAGLAAYSLIRKDAFRPKGILDKS